MLGALSVAPYRSTVFQSFRFLSKADAHAIMHRKQNRMAAAGDKALSQQAELDVAADDLASNRFVMGDHSLCLVVFADSMRALGDVATAAWRDLADSGAVAAREGAALEAAYFSMVPGNARLRVRPGVVSSRNFCAMAPLHNFPSGPERSHWGEPIALLRTSGGTPYRFHWHVGDVGNTLVTGETGSGKSLLVGFLIAMTAARARIIALDHKRGWELLIRSMGGQYAVLGAGQPHFAPLKALEATPRSLEFLTELLRGCIMMENGDPLTPEEDRRLALALQTVMEMPHEDRWVGEVRAFLGEDPNGAGARLDKWCWGNELGWVIDAPADAISLDGALHGLDTTALLENPRARGPALLYLFHRIELQLDGRPLLIPNDEGWRALLDDTFRPMIDRRLRTIRSFGGAFVFITQSPRDILDSGIAATLIEQCPTQIHMPNPRATEDDYVVGLKRTHAEFAALRELPKGSGQFLLCQGDKSTIAQLPLHGMDDEIAILSGREATLRLMEDVALKVGEDPAAWMPELSRRMKEMAA
jgi:type IV secretion system protein VirB4